MAGFSRGARGRTAVWVICLGMLVALSYATSAIAAGVPGVVAWGSGAAGELGNGSNQNASTYSPMAELTDVSSVAAGGNFALALLGNETVMSWGSNSAGQLGIGTTGGLSQAPVSVPSLTGVKAIAAGGEDALALMSNGTVEMWGAPGVDVTGSSTPKPVPGITDAVAIAAGSEDQKATENGADYLALLADGEVVAWGAGDRGQLGDGSESDSATPVTVRNLDDVTAISAGDGQNLALLSNKTVMAWGENNYGQLGDGSLRNADEPVPVESLSGAVAIAAGDKDSLALLEGGEVMGWGDNSEGELGPTAEAGGSSVPISVGGLSGVAAIAASTRAGIDINSIHNLALLSDGEVMAWGGDKEGELGDETEGGSSATPVLVSKLSGVTGIAAGASDGFAIGPHVPIVTGVTPEKGVTGTRVHVTGLNLEGATSVGFGLNSTADIEEDTETSLYTLAPTGEPRTVQVTVSTGLGTSAPTGAGSFRYEPEGPLEFGRCLDLGKHKGDYKKGCTLADSGGGWEWSTEILQPDFTLKGKGAEIASASGGLVVCSGSAGSGEYAGGKSVADVTITFTGCAVSKRKHATSCSSLGAPAGDIQSSMLVGAAGFTNKELDDVALELLPQEGGLFLTFTCGTTTTEVRGEALAGFSSVGSPASSFTVKFSESKGKQHLEGFEHGPAEVLEASVAGKPFEQVGLEDDITLANSEAVELNPDV